MSDVSASTARARAGLASAFLRFEEAASQLLRSGMEMAAADAKATTLFRDRSGETRDSITFEQVSPTGGFVHAAGAARFLENGTAPHWIGASVEVRPGVWRFIGMHPGTVERPFMRQARDLAAARLGAHAAEVVARALR